ncbi:MAG: hypothetical protein DRJ42_25275 [Deltaproteobacteria bacterium]|nr:MAG: hypothetical protein DRJ42_25275 [Deltaproteobacteria bacterium]
MSTDFAIEWDVALERLAEHLEPASLELVEGYAGRCAEDEVVLWIDEPWHELDYEAMAADAPVALAVFAAPLECDGPLALDAVQLLGDESQRDERGFVFLAEVTAEALTTLPGTVAVFAGGLEVDSAACFAAADATTHVASHLRAPFVFSGRGEGTLDVSPGTELSIQQLSGAFGGTMAPAQALPFLADTIEDDSVTSALWALREGHASVPKAFVWPGGYRAPLSVSRPAEADEVLDADSYRQYVASARMSEEGRALLQGMDDYLLDGGQGARFVSALPDGMSAIPERIVFVRDAIKQKEALSLVGRGDDGWCAYVFLRAVHCGDVFVHHNVVALFTNSLEARAVASAPSDCHLFISGGLKASVVCETVYIRRYSRLEIGTLAGGVVRMAEPAELFPAWADQLEQGTPLWELFTEAFDSDGALPGRAPAGDDQEEEDEAEEEEADEVGGSAFEVEWPEALARLKKARLPRVSLRAIEHYAKRHADSAVLWIDQPWADVDYEALAANRPVGLAVFAAPVECDGPMTLSAEELVGDTKMQDDRAFVFLDEVRAEALTTLPDTLAVFAGGLKVESAACFSASDASAFIASHLVAPCVVSGNSDGGASVLGKANVDVDVVVGSIEGGLRTLKTLSLNDAYRRWSAELEDGTRIWELFVVAFDDGESVGPGVARLLL